MFLTLSLSLSLSLFLQLAAKVSELQRQIVDVERQKQMIHEYLFSNNEAVSRVQREVTRSASGESSLL